MKHRAGIAIDEWKLRIFTIHLVEAGYQFTTDKFTDGTLILKVETEDLEALGKVVRAANEAAHKEAIRGGPKPS